MAIYDVNHFVIVSPSIQALELRDDFQVDFAASGMPANIKPNTVLEDDTTTASRALVNGEWMKVTQSATGAALKITRGGITAVADLDGLSVGDEPTLKYALFAERGRFDVQTLANKVPVIWQGAYEVDTKVAAFTGDNCIATSTAIGTRLVSCTSVIAGDTYAGYSTLGVRHAVGKGNVIGVITKMYNSTTGYVRIRVQAGGFGLYY